MAVISIREAVEAELVVQKSRFIAALLPVASEMDAREKLKAIQLKHSTARHNVFVYRIGNCERFSDDGEPSGTAGKPVLEVLRQENIDHVLLVVTRYFGGILLGAGGLIRAYANSAKAAVDAAVKVKLVSYRKISAAMDYTWLNKVQHAAELCGYIVGPAEYTEQVKLEFLVTEDRVDEFCLWITELSAGQLRAEAGESVLRAEPF